MVKKKFPEKEIRRRVAYYEVKSAKSADVNIDGHTKVKKKIFSRVHKKMRRYPDRKNINEGLKRALEFLYSKRIGERFTSGLRLA